MTDNTPVTQALEPVEVTQADRDAAAEFFLEAGWHGKGGTIKSGGRDGDPLVQAFARHRQSSSNAGGVDPTGIERSKVVMLERYLRRARRILGSTPSKIADDIDAYFSGNALTPPAPDRIGKDAVREALLDLPFASTAPIEWDHFEWLSAARALSATPAQPVDETERLRADLKAVADGDEFSFKCEGCGAPLLCNADDFVMDDDGVSGCWHAMAENAGADKPCYAYRVGKQSAALTDTKGDRPMGDM